MTDTTSSLIDSMLQEMADAEISVADCLPNANVLSYSRVKGIIMKYMGDASTRKDEGYVDTAGARVPPHSLNSPANSCPWCGTERCLCRGEICENEWGVKSVSSSATGCKPVSVESAGASPVLPTTSESPVCWGGAVNMIQAYADGSAEPVYDEAVARSITCHDALTYLVALKTHKDQFGKTPHYLEMQPIAWNRAINALENESSREPVSVSLVVGARAVCDTHQGKGTFDKCAPGQMRNVDGWWAKAAKACAEAWGLSYVD